MSEPGSATILDASALLALLNGEAGADVAGEAVLAGALMSAVNYSEVVGKLADLGIVEDQIAGLLDPLGLDIVPFDREQAQEAGMLRPATRDKGLVLGDRACLALARLRAASAVTADQAWGEVQLNPPIAVRFIR